MKSYRKSMRRFYSSQTRRKTKTYKVINEEALQKKYEKRAGFEIFSSTRSSTLHYAAARIADANWVGMDGYVSRNATIVCDNYMIVAIPSRKLFLS